MRISDRYEQFTDRVTAPKPSVTKSAESAGGAATAVPAAKSEILSVSVSDEARGLAAAGSARIEQLRDQVKNGTFKVDAKDIANKLVGEDA